MAIQLAIFQSATGQLVADTSMRTADPSWTTNEHGYERLSGGVDAGLAESFRMFYQTGIYHVEANWNTIALWEGRREDPGLHAGAADGGYDLGAIGYWHAFSDVPYVALWSTTSVAEWKPIEDTDLTSRNPKLYAIDTDNRVFIGLTKNTTYRTAGTGFDVGSMTVQTPDASTRGFVGFMCAIDIFLPVNWKCEIRTLTRGFGTPGSLIIFTGTGALFSRACYLTFAAFARLEIAVYNLTGGNVTFVGENGTNYARVTNLRAVTSLTNTVSTTLTANRAAGASVTATVGSTARMYTGMQLVMNSGGNPSEIVTVESVSGATTFVSTFVGAYVIGNAVQGFAVYADEVVADVLSTVVALNPSQVSSGTALIQSPALDLTDVSFEDTPCDAVLMRLAALGDTSGQPYEVGVYERRALFFRPRTSAGRAWYIDADTLDLQRSIADLINSAYATYQEPGGRTLRSATNADAQSVAAYALTRRGVASTTTTSGVQAASLRDTFIADQKNPLPRAKISFDQVYDAHGTRSPLMLVQSNSTLTIRNLSPSLGSGVDRIRTFRITHTAFRPAAGAEGEISVEIEMPLPTAVTTIVQVGKAPGDSRSGKNMTSAPSKNNKN